MIRETSAEIRAEILRLACMFMEMGAKVELEERQVTVFHNNWHTHYGNFSRHSKIDGWEIKRMRSDLYNLYEEYINNTLVMTYERAEKKGINPTQWFIDQRGNDKRVILTHDKEWNEMKAAFEELKEKVYE